MKSVYHVRLVSNPGTAKTMLAWRVPTILTPLTPAESLETTRIDSAWAGAFGFAAAACLHSLRVASSIPPLLLLSLVLWPALAALPAFVVAPAAGLVLARLPGNASPGGLSRLLSLSCVQTEAVGIIGRLAHQKARTYQAEATTSRPALLATDLTFWSG